MELEWDKLRHSLNVKKHRLSFEDVIPAFYDEYRLDFADPLLNEEPYHLIGQSHGVILFVVYTFREIEGVLKIRIISARKATKYE